ncbi:MAG: hypothetical protein LBP67_09890 [Bacteroidales bacterium]|jgi:hypothetical protein|nr:hypothetical protein [Bacteroidales bacterium]
MKKVKILRQSQIFFDDILNQEIPEHVYQVLTSDNKNNLISEITYNDENEEITKITREFDEENRLRKEIKEEKELDTEIVDFYYNDKLLIEEIREFGDMYMERNVYNYDDKGNCIEKIYFGEDDMIMDRKIMIYENGLLIRIENEEDGDVEIETEYSYDENGNKVEEIYHTLEGKEMTTNYFYENNLLVKTIVYNEFANISHIEENVYDERNRIIKTITKTHDDTITYLFDINENNQVYRLRIFNIKDEMLQEITRVYEDGELVSSVSMVFTPELNRKELTNLRYVKE